MTKTAEATAPEPEDPKTYEEQVAEYRKRRESTLIAVRNILAAPKMKTTATFQAALN